MKRRSTVLMVLTVILFSSCSEVVMLGKLNMISDRNIESNADYVLLKNYSGGSKKEIKKALKKSKIEDIDQAVDETVRNVAGGEFLKNVKIYGVKKSFKKRMYLFVEGDVWGFADNSSFRGFQVGDVVQWKEFSGNKKGTITGLTDSQNCMVREEGKEISKSIKFSSLVKVID